MLAPLAFGFPGGVELLVVLFVSLLLFSPLVALVYLMLFRRQVESVDEDRLADHESEVAEMRTRLDAETGDDDGEADDADPE